jgi:SAM-dependent methyltransferase
MPLPVCDTYMIMDVIHDRDDERAAAILSAVRNAAPPQARLLLIEGIIPDVPGPDWSKILDVIMLIFTGGRQRTRSEHESLCTPPASGWSGSSRQRQMRRSSRRCRPNRSLPIRPSGSADGRPAKLPREISSRCSGPPSAQAMAAQAMAAQAMACRPGGLPIGPRWRRIGPMDTAATAGYVHGYSDYEARRLADQANILADLLHAGTAYPAGSRVLEVGCGVGAQTVHLVTASPGARIVAVDLSSQSLAQARALLTARAPEASVEWRRADLFSLPFADATFDHLFVCFVLEHLPDPTRALAGLRRVLRPGGTITVIEGDHGSAIFHPDSAHAQAAIDCLIRLQSASGGNALIGRQLQPLLAGAGYGDVVVRPRTVYADQTRPEYVSGFTRNTFTAMVEAVRGEALAAGLSTAARWDQGIADLRRTADDGGTFHYTFFKAVAVNP